MVKILNRIKNKLSPGQRARLGIRLANIRALFHGGNLNKLAAIYGTDKWGKHYYTPHYHAHFQPFRFNKIKVLEIGAGGYENPYKGCNSVRMWRKYFPFAQIYTMDLHDKSFHREKRIATFQGSQTDVKFLENMINETGRLDIIIDDGSHYSSDVIKSFKALFPKLRNGGIYVVEDTQTSYWKVCGGNMNSRGTSMAFFKGLTDGLNHKEFMLPNYRASYFDKKIVSMHFYHNMVFIYKGNNDEESNVLVDNELACR